MSENSTTPAVSAEVRAHLHTISELLRHMDHISPEAQMLLADLVEELGKLLESSPAPSAEIARLTEHTSQFVQALHAEQPGILESARHRLEHAVVAAETEAPVLAGITRRLVDMLSNVGI